jgi:diguanylate cyclase (GGDEF)-like protein
MRTIVDLSQFISKLALAFVNVEPTKVDQEIKSALRQLGEYVKADSAYVYLFMDDGQYIQNTHNWLLPKNDPSDSQPSKIAAKELPWFTSQVTLGNMVYIPDVNNLPKEASKEKKFWERYKIRSLLALPFYRDKNPYGFIGFSARDIERKWGQDEVALLKIAGDLFSNVLARREAAQEQQEKVEELTALNQLATAMAQTNTVDELVEEAIQIISDTLYTDTFGIGVYNPEQKMIDTKVKLPDKEDKTFQLDPTKGITGKVFMTGKSVRVNNVEEDPDYLNLVFSSVSELCVPITVGENVIGIINVESKAPNAFSGKDQNLLELFARQLGLGIEKQRLFEKVQDLATKDPLTGLYNRRHFFDAAEAEFAQAKRYGTPLSLIMLDLDNLKTMNDYYGHTMGDRMLAEVGRLLRLGIRTADIAARYGGDEFVILLPGTNIKETYNLARRLQAFFSESQVRSTKEVVSISVSQGLAELDEDCTSLEFLLDRADTALLAVTQMPDSQILSWEELEKIDS